AVPRESSYAYQEENALKAAIEMQRDLAKLVEKWTGRGRSYLYRRGHPFGTGDRRYHRIVAPHGIHGYRRHGQRGVPSGVRDQGPRHQHPDQRAYLLWGEGLVRIPEYGNDHRAGAGGAVDGVRFGALGQYATRSLLAIIGGVLVYVGHLGLRRSSAARY